MKSFPTLFFLCLFIGLFLLNTTASQAQVSFERLPLDLTINGNLLPNGFAGGLDNPQFSPVNLNGDDQKDLYVFDRAGNVHLTFINTGDEYIYAPEYLDNFPRLLNFCLLRDYNGDGIEDIFAHAKSTEFVDGVIVYTGKMENGKIAFDRFGFYEASFNAITFELSNGTDTNLYVANVDLPDVNDIDGDGDLDILSFENAGGRISYFQNQSVEMGFGKDSLIFDREDDCWGKIYESSMSEAISLSDNPNSCAEGLIGDDDYLVDARHPGSTITSIDLNNDAARELAVGDVINRHILMLFNGGTNENAWMTSQDISYPSDEVPVDIPEFVAAYFFDADFDGKVDFVAAANTDNSPNASCAWLYENNGTNENPIFNKVKENYLTDGMLDLGSGTHPAFFDYNNDGLLDIVVGTYGVNISGGLRDSRLQLLENIGTADAPAYELVDDNWLNFKQYGLESSNIQTWNFAPAFGDLDGDGDEDLLVGEFQGNLFYCENTAGENNAPTFADAVPEWKGIDVGLTSTPQIIDLNRDGLLDLVIGERNGNINFIPNLGTATNPDFSTEINVAPNIPQTGGISMATITNGPGHSVPHFVDFEGSWRLFVGSWEKGVQVYTDINENDLGAAFTLEEELFGNIWDGYRTHPAIADLDDDGYYDLLLGNFRGGLTAHKTDLLKPLVATNLPLNIELKVFPNPAKHSLHLEWATWDNELHEVLIYNLLGQELFNQQVSGNRYNINVTDWQSGIYFADVDGVVVKFVVE